MWHASVVIKGAGTIVVVRAGLTTDEARRAMLSLVAMGVEAEATPDEPPSAGWRITVLEERASQAAPLIEDALTVDRIERRPDPPRTVLAPPGVQIWTLRNAAGSLAVAAACAVVHWSVHVAGAGDEPTSRSAMIDAGAAVPWLVRDGQWWRLASAVFLHFDLKHLLGNLSSLLLLGPPLAAQIGHVRTVALFVATGVLGNLLSQVAGSENAIKAGASGGVCGLLGALAGVALVSMASASDAAARRPAWQTLGALVALFGMIVGFEPGRDHYAHVGGVLAGVVLGRLFGVGGLATEAAPDPEHGG